MSDPVRASEGGAPSSGLRRRLLRTGMAVGLLGIGAGLYWGADVSLARAKAVAGACTDADYVEGPGRSLGCRGRWRGWLLLAKLLPWKRREAMATDARLRLDEATEQQELAAKVFADGELRTSATRELLRIVDEPGHAADFPTPDWVLATAVSVGDATAIVELADRITGSSSRFDRVRALDAAIDLADFPAAVRLARRADLGEDASDYDLRRGALLCLAGDRSAGARVLEATYRRGKVRLHAGAAAIACGKDLGGGWSGSDVEYTWLADLAVPASFDPALRREWALRRCQQAKVVPGPLLARAITTDAFAQPDGLLAQATRLLGPIAARPILVPAVTPWQVRAPQFIENSGLPFAFDPKENLAAANRLDALAAAVDRGEAKLPAGREAALQLQRVAVALRLDAAGMAASMFDRATLAQAIGGIPEAMHTGALALTAASYLMRVGENEAARRELARSLGSSDLEVATHASISLAMLELGAGKPREALTLLRMAAAKVGTAEGVLRQRIGWVLTAAALAANASDIPIGVPAPSYEDQGLTGRHPTTWLELARADEATRRLVRWRSMSQAPEFDCAVLPAIIYVLREVARDGKDPDVWVDTVLHLSLRSLRGISGLRARAEAARWRGHTAVAKRWDTRAAALERYFSTPRDALLARLAGLD